MIVAAPWPGSGYPTIGGCSAGSPGYLRRLVKPMARKQASDFDGMRAAGEVFRCAGQGHLLGAVRSGAQNLLAWSLGSILRKQPVLIAPGEPCP